MQTNDSIIEKSYLKKELSHFFPAAFLNLLPNEIWVADIDKKCIFFNKAWLDFRGRTVSDEYGDGWAQGVHPRDIDFCVNTYINAFDLRKSFFMEYRIKNACDEYEWMLDCGFPIYNAENNFLGYVGYCYILDEKEIDVLHQKDKKYPDQAGIARAALLQKKALVYDVNETFAGKISAQVIPHKHIGGDIYNIKTKDNIVAAVLLDTTGHDIEASVFANFYKSIIDRHFHLLFSEQTGISEFTRRLNLDLALPFAPDRFPAMTCMTLNMNSNELCYCSAGAPPPLIFREGKSLGNEVETYNIPLCFNPGLDYNVTKKSLNKNDAVILYSDAITPYFIMNLSGFTKDSAKNSQLILSEIKKQNLAVSDDITIVSIVF